MKLLHVLPVFLAACGGPIEDPRLEAYRDRPPPSPASDSALRETVVMNRGSLSLVSIRVDGEEILSGTFAPGQSASTWLMPGVHRIESTGAAWIDDAWAPIWSRWIDVSAGSPIVFEDPTIEELLSDFGRSTRWLSTWTRLSDRSEISSWFVFRTDGSWEWWHQDGEARLELSGSFRQIEQSATTRAVQLDYNGGNLVFQLDLVERSFVVAIDGVDHRHVKR